MVNNSEKMGSNERIILTMFLFDFYSTTAGVVCSDGIILGTEKIVINKMMVSGTDKRTYSISREVGCVSTYLVVYNSLSNREFLLKI